MGGTAVVVDCFPTSSSPFSHLSVTHNIARYKEAKELLINSKGGRELY